MNNDIILANNSSDSNETVYDETGYDEETSHDGETSGLHPPNLNLDKVISMFKDNTVRGVKKLQEESSTCNNSFKVNTSWNRFNR